LQSFYGTSIILIGEISRKNELETFV